MLADCALQAVEKLPKATLQKLKLFPNHDGEEEGIIDFIKTHPENWPHRSQVRQTSNQEGSPTASSRA